MQFGFTYYAISSDWLKRHSLAIATQSAGRRALLVAQRRVWKWIIFLTAPIHPLMRVLRPWSAHPQIAEDRSLVRVAPPRARVREPLSMMFRVRVTLKRIIEA